MHLLLEHNELLRVLNTENLIKESCPEDLAFAFFVAFACPMLYKERSGLGLLCRGHSISGCHYAMTDIKKAGQLVVSRTSKLWQALFCRIAIKKPAVYRYSKPKEGHVYTYTSRHSLLQCLDRIILELPDSEVPRTKRNKRCIYYVFLTFYTGEGGGYQISTAKVQKIFDICK